MSAPRTIKPSGKECRAVMRALEEAAQRLELLADDPKWAAVREGFAVEAVFHRTLAQTFDCPLDDGETEVKL